ncbi:hypothetical protein OSB04_020053, partial [Centaurea solstitialis]
METKATIIPGFAMYDPINSVQRTRLTPESTKCCICLKDYLDNIDSIENRTSLEMKIEEVDANLEENKVSTRLTTSTDTTLHRKVSQYEGDE